MDDRRRLCLSIAAAFLLNAHPGIAQSGASCDPDLSLGAQRPAPPEPRARATGCFVDAETFLEWRRAGPVSVVDLRRPEAFAQTRAPGSINLYPGVLRYKQHLREKRLLLVGEAGSTSELGALCLDLRGEGFQRLAVLDGGLVSWRDRVGPLAGGPAASSMLTVLRPLDVYREIRFDHWIVVNASDRDLADRLPAGALFSPLSRGEERFSSDLAEAVQRRLDRADPPSLLFLDEDGTQYAAIARLIAPLDISPAYYGEGGVAAYLAHLEDMQRMIARASSPAPQGCRRRLK